MAGLSPRFDIELDLRESVGLEESRATCESVSVRSPLLPVARLTVYVPVRAVAGNNRVQGLGAVTALVALSVPFTTLGEHLLSGKDNATAAGATLAGRGLDYCGVDHGGARSRIAASQRIARVISDIVFVRLIKPIVEPCELGGKAIDLSDHYLISSGQLDRIQSEFI